MEAAGEACFHHQGMHAHQTELDVHSSGQRCSACCCLSHVTSRCSHAYGSAVQASSDHPQRTPLQEAKQLQGGHCWRCSDVGMRCQTKLLSFKTEQSACAMFGRQLCCESAGARPDLQLNQWWKSCFLGEAPLPHHPTPLTGAGSQAAAEGAGAGGAAAAGGPAAAPQHGTPAAAAGAHAAQWPHSRHRAAGAGAGASCSAAAGCIAHPPAHAGTRWGMVTTGSHVGTCQRLCKLPYGNCAACCLAQVRPCWLICLPSAHQICVLLAGTGSSSTAQPRFR